MPVNHNYPPGSRAWKNLKALKKLLAPLPKTTATENRKDRIRPKRKKFPRIFSK